MDEEKLEEEAKKYFGEDFIKEYEELKKKLKDEQIHLFLHGTEKESAEEILKKGLLINSPSIRYTSYPDASYKTMKHWPHRNYKNLVLIGIPNEATKLVNFDYDENGEFIGVKEKQVQSKPIFTIENENNGFKTVYKLPAEFIIGYVDVENKTIVNNPLYLSEHTYEDLYVRDSELGTQEPVDLSFYGIDNNNENSLSEDDWIHDW